MIFKVNKYKNKESCDYYQYSWY